MHVQTNYACTNNYALVSGTHRDIHAQHNWSVTLRQLVESPTATAGADRKTRPIVNGVISVRCMVYTAARANYVIIHLQSQIA